MKRKLLLLFCTVICICAIGFFGCSSPSNDGKQIDLSGITFENAVFTYDGTEKTLLVSGNLPEDISVAYSSNTATNAGTYTAVAKFSGNGYADKSLTATLTINKADYDMSNASWDYSSPFTYDGQNKTVSLSGLPSGVSVASYINNSKINAGSYSASATFTFDTLNYNTPSVLPCAWVINKAEITGITVNNNQEVSHDGQKHLPEYSGTLPAGVSPKYFFDDIENNQGVQAIGTYNAIITFSGDNYIEKSFECTYKIKLNALSLATTVVSAFGSTPDAWSFLPDSFSAENKTLSSIPNYNDFYSVSFIPTNGIGKQLSVVYGVLNKTTKALSFVQPIYSVLNTIKTLYTEFIDKNPENYKSFTGTAGGLTFNLSLSETQYSISAMVKNIQVVIYADVENETYGAKIQLTPTTVLKYTVSENYLLMAINILNVSATHLEFVRDEDVVTGMVYEYLHAGETQLTATSAMIHVGETYTTLIGTKGDFIPTSISRNCEVYRNSTGCLVGTEVREELEIGGFTDTYNTLWYNLSDISGITSIKKIDEANKTNPDTIYINGSSDTIHTKLVILPLKKGASRRFDIEFKTMYFYTYNSSTEEYEEVSCEIPMMFIQEENLDSFEEDFESENKNSISGNISLNVSTADKSAVNYGYYTLLIAYDKLIDAVSFEDISNYCSK